MQDKTFQAIKVVAFGEELVDVGDLNGDMFIAASDEGPVIITEAQARAFFGIVKSNDIKTQALEAIGSALVDMRDEAEDNMCEDAYLAGVSGCIDLVIHHVNVVGSVTNEKDSIESVTLAGHTFDAGGDDKLHGFSNEPSPLRAQLNQMREAVINIRGDLLAGFSICTSCGQQDDTKDLDAVWMLSDALDTTPEQCVNDIKAQALEDMADSIELAGPPNILTAAIKTHEAIIRAIRLCAKGLKDD